MSEPTLDEQSNFILQRIPNGIAQNDKMYRAILASLSELKQAKEREAKLCDCPHCGKPLDYEPIGALLTPSAQPEVQQDER